jgi:hypothetical protein
MRRIFGATIALALMAVLLTQAAGVFAQPTFADDAFARVWNRQDRAVYENRDLNRSWTWGPENISGLLREDYAESVESDGKRTVQYFDKSRMEINDPTADPNDLFYVTNGLLPIEMMTGRLQTGNARFEQVGPANISAIGDPGNFPTYADLLQLYQSPGTVNPGDLNRPVTRILNADGSVTNDFDDFINDAGTVLRQADNGHGVAQAFLDFQNIRGLIYVNNQYINGQVFEPLFVFGLPVTEPYWVNATVGGEQTPVLFQIFERRVLTYNPANEPNFRVEMGNVGRHFYEWRYGDPNAASNQDGNANDNTDNAYPTP